MRRSLNPDSKLLSNAIVGGAGFRVPPDANPPEGMAVVLLYVPIEAMMYKNAIEIQQDMGIPWSAGNGKGVWLDELTKSDSLHGKFIL